MSSHPSPAPARPWRITAAVLAALGVVVWMWRRSVRRRHDPDDHIDVETLQ